MVLAGLPVAADQEERQRALAIEREAGEVALQALLRPALVPSPAMSSIDRESWAAAMASLQPGAELPKRERTRNRAVVERVEVVPEPASESSEANQTPAPAAAPAEPAPATVATPAWRVNLLARRGQA